MCSLMVFKKGYSSAVSAQTPQFETPSSKVCPGGRSYKGKYDLINYSKFQSLRCQPGLQERLLETVVSVLHSCRDRDGSQHIRQDIEKYHLGGRERRRKQFHALPCSSPGNSPNILVSVT